MNKRRSLFVTGVLLSALVLFGTTTASAQSLADVTVTVTSAAALDHDSIRVRWTVNAHEQVANITAFEIRYQEGDGAEICVSPSCMTKRTRMTVTSL